MNGMRDKLVSAVAFILVTGCTKVNSDSNEDKMSTGGTVCVRATGDTANDTGATDTGPADNWEPQETEGYPGGNTDETRALDTTGCTADPATQCYNDGSYQLFMVRENTWVRTEILFEDLEIGSAWGLQPEAFVQTQVFGMRFQVMESSDFDFCIDDIYLIPADQ